jgi:hypothetical protein
MTMDLVAVWCNMVVANQHSESNIEYLCNTQRELQNRPTLATAFQLCRVDPDGNLSIEVSPVD